MKVKDKLTKLVNNPKTNYIVGWVVMSIAAILGEPALGIVGFACSYFAWETVWQKKN